MVGSGLPWARIVPNSANTNVVGFWILIGMVLLYLLIMVGYYCLADIVRTFMCGRVWGLEKGRTAEPHRDPFEFNFLRLFKIATLVPLLFIVISLVLVACELSTEKFCLSIP